MKPNNDFLVRELVELVAKKRAGILVEHTREIGEPADIMVTIISDRGNISFTDRDEINSFYLKCFKLS